MHWGSMVAIVAVVVAVASLAYTIVSERNAQEREYLYKSYDRLVDLSALIHKNIENIAARNDAAKDISSSDEATEKLGIYMHQTIDDVTRAKWSIDLHQLFIDQAALDALNERVENVYEAYMSWEKDRQKSQATAEHLYDYAESVDAFWKQIEKTVGASLAEIARRLRP